MSKSLPLYLTITIVSGLFLTGCIHETLGGESTLESPTIPEAAQVTVTPSAISDVEVEDEAMMAEEKVDFTLETANFSFTPSTIQAKAGQTIKVKLVNNVGMHDFVIDELGVKSDLLQGDDKTIVTIKVPAEAAGQSYEFYCSVGNHRAMGMVGTLVVK